MFDGGSTDNLDTVRLGYFSASAVSLLAQHSGIYQAHGLAVTEDAVPSSTEQMRRLIAGEYDLVLTSPDNVLNYRVNDNYQFARSDLRILTAVDRGLGLSLMASPGTLTVGGLRGRRIGVDVPNSGFAYALYEMLARAGVARQDYEIVAMGSTPGRARGLADGTCDATLLNAGHDLLAEAAGAHRLARVSDVLGPYPGTVLAAHADSVAGRPEIYVRFVKAWSAAVAATLDPLNRERVVSALAHGLDAPTHIAEGAYETVIDGKEGLIADGRFDAAGWRLIVDLRFAFQGLDADVDLGLLRQRIPVIDTRAATTVEQGL